MLRLCLFLILFVAFLFGQALAALGGDNQSLMQLYAITLCLLSILPVFYVVRHRPGFLLSCFSAVFLAPVWFLYLEAAIPGGDCWLLPASSVIQALSLGPVFLAIFTIAYRNNSPASLSRFHEKHFNKILSPNLLPTFAIVLTGVIVFVVLFKFNFDWDAVKYEYLAGRRTGSGGIIKRGGIGGWDVFLQPLGFMAPIVPTIAALSLVKFKYEGKASPLLSGFVLVLAVFLVFVMFLGGSRGNMAIYLAGPAAIWWLFGRNYGKTIFLTVSVLAFTLLIGIWEYQKHKRSDLLSGIDSVSDVIEQTSFNPAKTHRDNNLYILTLNVMHRPDPYPYSGFGELFYLAVNPIPRAIWKNKPKGIQESRDSFRNPKGPVSEGPVKIGTASLSSTIIGNGYGMASILGVAIWGAIFGFVASIWDYIGQNRLTSTKLYFILNSAWIFWMLWGFRAAFAFVTGMYSVWGAYLGCYILARFAWPIPPDELVEPGEAYPEAQEGSPNHA